METLVSALNYENKLTDGVVFHATKSGCEINTTKISILTNKSIQVIIHWRSVEAWNRKSYIKALSIAKSASGC